MVDLFASWLWISPHLTITMSHSGGCSRPRNPDSANQPLQHKSSTPVEIDLCCSRNVSSNIPLAGTGQQLVGALSLSRLLLREGWQANNVRVSTTLFAARIEARQIATLSMGKRPY